METKTCSKCGETKLVADFPKYERRCKSCRSAYNAAYRSKNADALKAYFAAHYQMHKEEKAVKQAQYQRANRGRINAARRAHYADNKALYASKREARSEYLKTYFAKRYAENKPQISAEEKARYQRRRDQLEDRYVRSCLGVSNPPPELIEMKREQLALHRLTKQLNEVLKEKRNGNE